MNQSFFSSKFYLLIVILVATSCGSQLSKTNTIESSNTGKVIDGQPRVDSVLQMSVMITSIFEDSKGNFWFGSHGDGLCRYDGKEYIYFTVGHGLPEGIDREFAPGLDWNITKLINGGNQVGCIQEDRNGNIYIVTGDNGVCKFNGQSFEPMKVDEERPLPLDRSRAVWKEDLDHLWFGYHDRLGVYRLEDDKLVFLKLPPPFVQKNDGVSELYKDNVGNVWIGTMGNGTFRYDGKSFTLINKKDEIGICRSVFQDNTGRTWITNNRFNLNYLEGDSLYNFKQEYSLKHSKDDLINDFKTSYQCINQDNNGDLWFGTFGSGVWRYDGDKLTHFTQDKSLKIDLVKVIYKDKSGNLWYSIGEGSVYGFDGKSFYRFDAKE